jgi:hypothetical protein
MDMYADEATCLSERTAAHLALQEAAETAGLEYPAECARLKIQYVRDIGCSRSPPTCLWPTCSIYNGTATGSCTGMGGFLESCVPGRRCMFQGSSGPSMCIAISDPLEPGDPCGPPYDCGYYAYCPLANSTCTSYARVGDACGTDVARCHPTLFCNATSGRCETGGSENDPCSATLPCAQGLRCDLTTDLCVPNGMPTVCSTT